jgi:hypothetical protein
MGLLQSLGLPKPAGGPPLGTPATQPPPKKPPVDPPIEPPGTCSMESLDQLEMALK